MCEIVFVFLDFVELSTIRLLRGARFKILCYFASNNPRLVPILSVWREFCWRTGPIFDAKKSQFSKIPEFSRNRSNDPNTFPRDRGAVPGSQITVSQFKIQRFCENPDFRKIAAKCPETTIFDVSGTAGLTLARPSWGRAAFHDFPVTRSFS